MLASSPEKIFRAINALELESMLCINNLQIEGLSVAKEYKMDFCVDGWWEEILTGYAELYNRRGRYLVAYKNYQNTPQVTDKGSIW